MEGGRLVNDNRKGIPTPDAEVAEGKEHNEIDSVSGGMIGLRGSGHKSRSVRGVARSFGGGRRDIDGATIVVGAVAVVGIVVEKCADVTPAGTGSGAKFRLR